MSGTAYVVRNVKMAELPITKTGHQPAWTPWMILTTLSGLQSQKPKMPGTFSSFSEYELAKECCCKNIDIDIDRPSSISQRLTAIQQNRDAVLYSIRYHTFSKKVNNL